MQFFFFFLFTLNQATTKKFTDLNAQTFVCKLHWHFSYRDTVLHSSDKRSGGLTEKPSELYYFMWSIYTGAAAYLTWQGLNKI